MHDNQHQDWDALFNQLPMDSTANAEQIGHVRRRVLAAFESHTAPRTKRITLQAIGLTLMKYKIPHGIAATLLIAGMIWMFPSVSSPALALDSLIENLMNVKSARYEIVTDIEGQPQFKMKGFYLEPALMREELNGYTTISDWSARKKIGLDSIKKQATVFNLKNIPDDFQNSLQQGNWFEGTRQMLRAASADPNAKVISLGEKVISGRRLVGVRFEMQGAPMTIWADPMTQLPFRIESTLAGPPKSEVVITNFEFNIELDKSLFSVEIPEGYTVSDIHVDLSQPTENELTTALRICAEVSDGQFPTGFDAYSIGKYAAIYIHSQGSDAKQGTTVEQLQETLKIARGFQFVLMLPKESNLHYAGTGAKYGDANRAVLWYKPIGSDNYRVIYADLSVRDSEVEPKVGDAVKRSN